MRERLMRDRDTGEWFTADEYYARKELEIKRSGLPCPMLISDGIEIKSMVDGQIYSSKSALRRSYRERGYVEVGNEEMKVAPRPKPDRKAIRNSAGRALNKVGISVG